MMLKKLFILFVLAVFVLYCYDSVVHYSSVPVPNYVERKIDLYGGMSSYQWKRDPTFQNEHFAALVREQLQAPVTGLNLASGLVFPAEHILTEVDLRAIAQKEPVLARDLPVRDPVKIYDMEERNLVLRDNVLLDGKLLFPAMTPLDKKAVDVLQEMGIREVRVNGRGAMVAPQSGTMIMVVLIFLGLLCALDLVLFKPLVDLVDERNDEIEVGEKLAKHNLKEQAKLTAEELDKRRALRREHISNLVKARHAVMREADAILHEANVEGHRMRDNAHMEMKQMIAASEEKLRAEVAVLAEVVVERLRS